MKKKKSAKLGQNFLINKGVAEKIVEEFFPITETIIEIGPGKGVLTEMIINKAKTCRVELDLILVEIDRELAGKLVERSCQFKVLNKSILGLKPEDFDKKNIQLIGNVPYYISKEIMDWIIKNYKYIKSGVLMFQKEFVDKLLNINDPKTKNAQNLLFNYLFEAQKVLSVHPGSFYPVPKVNSTVFKFNKNKDRIKNINDFYIFLKNCFLNRRKTLINNFDRQYKANIENILQKEKLKITIRAEEIDIKTFINIYNVLEISE